MEQLIEPMIDRYQEQFCQLECMLAQMYQISGYLTRQFDALDVQLGRG